VNVVSIAIIGVVASIVLSSVLAVLILPPTRAVLRKTCPTQDAVSFWVRFTILMLFIGPLIVTLVFGVPSSRVAATLTSDDMLIRVGTSTLVGCFLTLGAIGLRMGTLRSPSVTSQSRPRTDDEFIK
jgi:hypothetical protein